MMPNEPDKSNKLVVKQYDPTMHHRRSVRLQNYDYAQAGVYFLTICTQLREHIFGEVIDDKMYLNLCGTLAQSIWQEEPLIRKELTLDAFVVMPNHVHGIVLFHGSDTISATGAVISAPESGSKPSARRIGQSGYPRSLSRFVAGYKGAVTSAINTKRNAPGVPVWQRNYYEHVIRNDDDLDRIRRYIEENPARWANDPENRATHSPHP